MLSLPFATPFFYTGGTLCIDIAARRVAGRECGFWPIEAVLDPARGITTTIGASCNPHRSPKAGQDSSITAHERDLVPGSTAMFVGDGSPGGVSAFLLGFAPLDVDLALVGLAEPGCVLRVDSTIALLGTFATEPHWPHGTTGEAPVIRLLHQ